MLSIKYHQTKNPYFGVNEHGKNKDLQELTDSILSASPIEIKEINLDLRTEPQPTFREGIAFDEEQENGADSLQINEQNKDEIAEILRQIAAIMSNPETIFRHLKDLDYTLGEKLREQGIELIDNRPQYLIASAGSFVPGPWPENYRPLRKNKLLNQELLRRENEHGINLDGVAMFDGFVGNDEANQFVNDGHIFSEEEQKAKFLFHGKYTHRLCFEIIRKAAESEELSLKVNERDLTQKQLLQITTSTWCKNSGISTWGVLTDSSEESNQLIEGSTKLNEEEYRKRSLDYKNYSFSGRSPFVFKSLITCFGGGELPNLSSYLLDSHYKQVAQMVYKIRGNDLENSLETLPDKVIYTHLIDAISTGEKYRIENILSDFPFLAKNKSKKTEEFSPKYNKNIRQKKSHPKNDAESHHYASIRDYIKEKNARDFEKNRDSILSQNSWNSLSDSELEEFTEKLPRSEASSPSIKKFADKKDLENDQNR